MPYYSTYSHGQVFVFSRFSNGTWSDEPRILEASEPIVGDCFGEDVSISENRILVGASEKYVYDLNDDGSCCNYTTPQRGKVFVYAKIGDTWEQEGDPLQPDNEATDPQFHFGASVALNGDTALIGHDSQTGGVYWDNGIHHSNLIVYGFTRAANGQWVQAVKLTPSSLGKDINKYGNDLWKFGRGVKVGGNKALITGTPNSGFLFINLEYVATEEWNLYTSGVIGSNLALGSNEIFVGGNDEGYDYGRAIVKVIDNFTDLVSDFKRVGTED